RSVLRMRVPSARSRDAASTFRVASVFGPRVFEIKIHVSSAADTQATPKMISIFCRSIYTSNSSRIPQEQQGPDRNHGAVCQPQGARLVDIAALAKFR